MDLVPYIKTIFALIIVTISIFIILNFLKKFYNLNLFKGNLTKRLNIIDMIYLDPKKKIILIKRDNIEHLIYCSENNISVIETIKHE